MGRRARGTRRRGRSGAVRHGRLVAASGLPGDQGRTVALVRALAHGIADLRISGHLRKQPSSPGPEELVRSLLSALERAE
jgi:hypothetical protein